jgi:hypothetical protein
MTHPSFIFLNHGKITADSFTNKGIDEVSFILFKNNVGQYERQLIMKDCPSDLKKGCFWSDKFIFFNPVSNETAEDIIKMNYFISDKGKNENEDIILLEKLLSGIPERADIIEKWFCKVNSISEISICNSPFIPEKKDDWGQWSDENFFSCGIPVINGILENNFNIAQHNSIESRYFFRIHDYILNYLTIKANIYI